jgi:hypothetical protein
VGLFAHWLIRISIAMLGQVVVIVISQWVFSPSVERSPFPLSSCRKDNVMKLRESYRAAKELPAQIKSIFNLAISALFVALIALAMSIGRA